MREFKGAQIRRAVKRNFQYSKLKLYTVLGEIVAGKPSVW